MVEMAVPPPPPHILPSPQTFKCFRIIIFIIIIIIIIIKEFFWYFFYLFTYLLVLILYTAFKHILTNFFFIKIMFLHGPNTAANFRTVQRSVDSNYTLLDSYNYNFYQLFLWSFNPRIILV